MEHKMAAFHYMLHRACNLLLARENFEKKVAYIKETAGLNGYTETTIDGLMSKQLFKRKIKEVTTLSPISKKVTTKRAGLTFHPSLSRKISNIMAKHDIQMVPKALRKLAQVLGSKNVVDEMAKSGIYAIQCQTRPVVYFEQTRRRIDERFKEHISMVRTSAKEKSSVAKPWPCDNSRGHVSGKKGRPSTTSRYLGVHNHS
jgi:hypothetical protein